MSNTVIYHNPRCSKSRQTLALLDAQNVEYRVKEYLKEGLNVDELTSLQAQLKLASPLAMMRPKEAEFKSLGLTKETNADTLLDAIVQCPKLLERPIVVHNGSAAIGRPPEDVLALFK
jgi:arsenate reductase